MDSVSIKPYFETALGKLYCGDCLEIMKEIPDKSVDLVLTDPPYGIDIASKGTVGVGVMAPLKDYGISDWDISAPPQNYFNEMIRISRTAIIFGGNYFTDKLPVSKCWVCWDKQIPKGFTKAQIEMLWTNSSSYSRIYPVLWHGMIRDKKGANIVRYHPTQKPYNLITKILQDFSKEGNLVLDCFLGSGTTAIACEKLGRRWIGIEISEKYCAVAARRIGSEAAQLKLFKG